MDIEHRFAAGRAAYLGDHAAVAGASVLLEQLRATERFAAARWGSPTLRLFVDSGCADDAPERAQALERLLGEVRAGGVRDVVIARRAALSPSRLLARRAIQALEAAGAVVHVAGRARCRRAAVPRDAGR